MKEMCFITSSAMELSRRKARKALAIDLSSERQRGHYVAFGPTGAGRYLAVIFEKKPKGIVRPITGWDMNRSEVQYYRKRGR